MSVIAAVRSQNADIAFTEPVLVENIDGNTDWSKALAGVSVVVHLAARAHVLRETAADPLQEFHRINVEATERLARQAATNGVRRLVYVSSIGVNGKLSEKHAFQETDAANPHNAYALSKRRAELALMQVASETGLEVVVVRPPLVYGPNVPGNFAQMLKILSRDIPLPLASARNLRSLIYVRNLVDALILCVTHPAAAGQIYLLSDGEDISTPDLLYRLGKTMGHPARLFPCPLAMLKIAGHITGKSGQLAQLLGSLQVDSAKIRRELGWQPPYTLRQGLQETAKWYRKNYL